MNIPFKFVNKFQEVAFYEIKRNQCLSGGYGNGKTLIACFKLLYLLGTFKKYRVAIARREFKQLRQTTMKTFFKICPPEIVDSHNEQDGRTTLRNGSEIVWLNLDKFDEQTLRGLEINSAFVDQAEELDEGIFDTIQARVGRWDDAVPPPELIAANPKWPRNKFTEKPLAPAYMIIACNPDSEIHWIYRKFHPDSTDWQLNFKKDYVMHQAASTDNPALDPATLKAMLAKDPEWVNRFVYGQWGITGGTIHTILPVSIIDPSQEWLDNFKKKSVLYRTYDHGESSPSCCLWWATHNQLHVCYREYYAGDLLISAHRQNISDLSAGEVYSGNYADPDIFKKHSQRLGGRFAVSDDYLDRSLCPAPPIMWQPADNNELGVRNRINEMLKLNPTLNHPVSGELNSPQLYFIRKGENHPNGCEHSIIQTRTQRRKEEGTYNGKKIYSDDRDETVTDHGYDPVRYYFSIHINYRENVMIRPPANSFFNVRKQLLMLKKVHDEAQQSGKPQYIQ